MFQWRVCKYVFLICFVRFLFCWPCMMVGSSFSLCLHRWFYSVDLFQSFLPFILFFLGFQLDLIRLPVKRGWLDMYRGGTWLCLCELLHLGREENLVDFLVTCQSVFLLLCIENLVDSIIFFNRFFFVVLYISYRWRV